ncbi:hypothetical protein HDU93_008102 [Gonapodya sp. JEL0774]|nr:hypothetical protein HDU93_008102 [Gonapodya sp. JEL0774]
MGRWTVRDTSRALSERRTMDKHTRVWMENKTLGIGYAGDFDGKPPLYSNIASDPLSIPSVILSLAHSSTSRARSASLHDFLWGGWTAAGPAASAAATAAAASAAAASNANAPTSPHHPSAVRAAVLRAFFKVWERLPPHLKDQYRDLANAWIGEMAARVAQAEAVEKTRAAAAAAAGAAAAAAAVSPDHAKAPRSVPVLATTGKTQAAATAAAAADSFTKTAAAPRHSAAPAAGTATLASASASVSAKAPSTVPTASASSATATATAAAASASFVSPDRVIVEKISPQALEGIRKVSVSVPVPPLTADAIGAVSRATDMDRVKAAVEGAVEAVAAVPEKTTTTTSATRHLPPPALRAAAIAILAALAAYTAYRAAGGAPALLAAASRARDVLVVWRERGTTLVGERVEWAHRVAAHVAVRTQQGVGEVVEQVREVADGVGIGVGVVVGKVREVVGWGFDEVRNAVVGAGGDGNGDGVSVRERERERNGVTTAGAAEESVGHELRTSIVAPEDVSEDESGVDAVSGSEHHADHYERLAGSHNEDDHQRQHPHHHNHHSSSSASSITHSRSTSADFPSLSPTASESGSSPRLQPLYASTASWRDHSPPGSPVRGVFEGGDQDGDNEGVMSASAVSRGSAVSVGSRGEGDAGSDGSEWVVVGEATRGA